MHSYLAGSDVAATVRLAQEEGQAVGLITGIGTDTIATGDIARGGVEIEALAKVSLGDVLPDGRRRSTLANAVEYLVGEGCRLVVVALQPSGWGEVAYAIAYAGEPVATVDDVSAAQAAGDALDVRHGELWIESPTGSMNWHYVGVILQTVAVALRKAGVPVGR